MVVSISESHVHRGSVCITTESFYHWRQGQKINEGGIRSKVGPFVPWYQKHYSVEVTVQFNMQFSINPSVSVQQLTNINCKSRV
jgi:hypothetical protein